MPWKWSSWSCHRHRIPMFSSVMGWGCVARWIGRRCAVNYGGRPFQCALQPWIQDTRRLWRGHVIELRFPPPLPPLSFFSPLVHVFPPPSPPLPSLSSPTLLWAFSHCPALLRALPRISASPLPTLCSSYPPPASDLYIERLRTANSVQLQYYFAANPCYQALQRAAAR